MKAGLGIMALFIAAIAGMVIVTRNRVEQPMREQSDRLDGLLAKAKAAGFPMVAEDLKREPALTAEEDGEDLLRRYGTVARANHLSFYTVWEFDRNPKKKEARAELLKIASEFTTRKGVSLSDDLDLAWLDNTWLTVGPLESVAKLLADDAVLAAERGHYDLALERAAQASRIPAMLGERPAFSGWHTQSSLEEIAHRAFVETAPFLVNDPTALEKLKALALSTAPLPEMGDVLRGEYYSILASLRNHAPLVDKPLVHMTGEQFRGYLKHVKREGSPTNLAHRAQLASVTAALLELDAYSANHNDAEIVRWIESWLSTNKPNFTNGRATKFMEDALSIPLRRQRKLGERAARSAAVALWAYRAKHGSFPAKLTDAGVTWPDPCNGKELRYKRTAEGFSVYSVSYDLKDDGGGWNQNSKDAGFSYPKPKPPRIP